MSELTDTLVGIARAGAEARPIADDILEIERLGGKSQAKALQTIDRQFFVIQALLRVKESASLLKNYCPRGFDRGKLEYNLDQADAELKSYRDWLADMLGIMVEY